MSTKWIPEVPAPAAPTFYRAKEPHREGKLGERLVLITPDASAALQFDTREACEAWITANPHPEFEAREHVFA